jgi:hypothetical protein
MECAICFERFSSNFMGVGCQRCKKRCCISCDVQSQNCPFCRNKISWTTRFQKANPKKFKLYLRSLVDCEVGKLSRFLQNKKLFIALMNSCPKAVYAFHQLEDDEDLFNLMIIARDYIFGVAMHTKNIDDIDFLLDFIEHLYERLENPDIDLKLDLDLVEELLFENLKIKKTYPESAKKAKYSPHFHKGTIRRRLHYQVKQ